MLALPYLLGGSALAGALLAAGATYSVVHNANAVEIAALKLSAANLKTASVQMSLDKLQGFIANINIAGIQYQATLSELDRRYIEIQGRLGKLARTNPLPIDCKPDFMRLQIYNSAIDSANGDTSPTP